MNPLHCCRPLFAFMLVMLGSTSAPRGAETLDPVDPGVTVQGEVVLAKGYGTADRGLGLPITTQTVFDIGSLGKQFIAAGVLLLESRGRLSVSDTIDG